MSALQELDAALQPMLLLKPPGVSGSKIKEITALCVANVKSESVIIQKIFTHFKKAPGTHKLGVLYVVDSVTRQWVDHARKAGQTMGNVAGDGTCAAGVNRVTELLPVLMTDLIQHAPEDQKEKIKKLVDIWERGSTFPAPLLSSFKEKLNAPPTASSTTPPGTPPGPQVQGQQASSAPTAPAPNTSAILAALANIAKQNTATPSMTTNGPPDNTYHVSNTQNALPQAVSSAVNQAPSFPSAAHPVDGAAGGASAVPSFSGFNLNGAAPQNTSTAPGNPFGALATMMPQANAAGGGGSGGGAGPDALQQQLMLIQVLMQQGVPQDQWAPILAALSAGGANAAMAGINTGVASGAAWPQAAAAQNAWNGRSDAPSRDRNGGPGDVHMQSPTNQYRRHTRSRSPSGWGRDREASPPRRRDSPTYGEYGSPGRGGNRGDASDRHGRGRGGRGRNNEYRQRSPAPNRRDGSPSGRGAPPSGGPKWIEYDYTIGKDNIKVLSRTLFIGGVTCNEGDLRSVFSQFGTVQTCIVNQDKRHGFIKMISRADALAAKDGMETYKPPDMHLRTRWGVGFGPRDCSDYQTGISVIPIGRLTDADRKWMLTAEYGGSGGKPIEGSMVVEEPDIEIGAGVSSKAISRRMATDQGGRTGPRSTRTGNEGGGGGRSRRNDRQDGPGPERDSVNAIGVAPAVPGFGFQFPGFPNGMPMMPSGFVFPGTGAQQPPPPGQT